MKQPLQQKHEMRSREFERGEVSFESKFCNSYFSAGLWGGEEGGSKRRKRRGNAEGRREREDRNRREKKREKE